MATFDHIRGGHGATDGPFRGWCLIRAGGRATILLAIKGLGIGGAERLISEGARYWDRDTFDYHVAYALPWKDQLVPALESRDVPTHLVGKSRGVSPATLVSLRRLVRKLDADVVHAHLPLMGVVARMASSAPVVYTEHNLTGSYRYPSRVLNRLTYRRNAAVIAVSAEVAHSLAGYPGPAPQVIPNGVFCRVGDQEASAARAELGVGPGDPLVVHVGNIRPHKGHETLIGSVAKMAELVPEVTVVSIGGEKRPGDLSRVRELAGELGVSDRIRFLGRRPDALEFIATADVLVNPSDIEGMPVTILEAMALGVPVVATSVGGVASIIEHRGNGLLVEPRSPELLGEAVASLLLNPSEAMKYAQRARNLVDEAHSLEGMVTAYEGVYRAILDE